MQSKAENFIQRAFVGKINIGVVSDCRGGFYHFRGVIKIENQHSVGCIEILVLGELKVDNENFITLSSP